MERTQQNLHHLHDYLTHSIRVENIYGDYFLASLVQDAVVQMFTEDAMPDVVACLPAICEGALRAVCQLVVPNYFVIRETIRGVTHGLVSLGADAKDVVVSVKDAIRHVPTTPFGQEGVLEAMRKGVDRACEDLGLPLDAVDGEVPA
jgi:hypothetical protein